MMRVATDLICLRRLHRLRLRNSRLYERARQEARTDEMTGLLNRKYFYEVLNEELSIKTGEASLALMIINVDDFKLYNQLWLGVKEGDLCLQLDCRYYQKQVSEKVDTRLAMEGKEFMVLYRDMIFFPPEIW